MASLLVSLSPAITIYDLGTHRAPINAGHSVRIHLIPGLKLHLAIVFAAANATLDHRVQVPHMAKHIALDNIFSTDWASLVLLLILILGSSFADYGTVNLNCQMQGWKLTLSTESVVFVLFRKKPILFCQNN